MRRTVIAVYAPRPGQEQTLLALVKKHLPVLRAEGLVSDRPGLVMRAANGTLIEVFEWLSPEAIEAAHKNAAVAALWAEFGAACEFTPLAQLAEAQQMFAEFDSVEP